MNKTFEINIMIEFVSHIEFAIFRSISLIIFIKLSKMLDPLSKPCLNICTPDSVSASRNNDCCKFKIIQCKILKKNKKDN